MWRRWPKPSGTVAGASAERRSGVFVNIRQGSFARFAGREGIDDAVLCDAAERAVNGLVDAGPGGGVIKQRIARPGQGRSGGVRALVLYRLGERAFFVHGFAKSAR